MKDCRWLKPQLVGQFEFVEWTSDNHLRHSGFVTLREDKKARKFEEKPRLGCVKPDYRSGVPMINVKFRSCKRNQSHQNPV